jgi:hypothetical protein
MRIKFKRKKNLRSIIDYNTSKSDLIFKTCNSLNHGPELNQET